MLAGLFPGLAPDCSPTLLLQEDTSFMLQCSFFEIYNEVGTLNQFALYVRHTTPCR